MKAKLKCLSICPCGFAVLDDSIKLDTEYDVDFSRSRLGFTYGCGGCGTVHTDVMVIAASSVLNPTALRAYLPVALFFDHPAGTGEFQA